MLDLRRREFITLLGGAAVAWPLAGRAQGSDRIRRLGMLNALAEDDLEAQANLTAVWQVLQKLSWNDGHNVRIDYRWGGADPGRILAQAKELAGLKPDVILVSSALALQPLLQETRSIPVVFVQIADPVGAGLVASLPHPRGNVTGFTVAEYPTYGKLLEVLKEVAPNVTRVAVIFAPDQIPQAGILRAVEAAAPSLQVQVTVVRARNVVEIAQDIDQFARAPNGGLIVLPNPVTIGNRNLVIAMAARHRLPAAYAFRHFVAEGGLVSYGIDLADQYRQAASYADRILAARSPPTSRFSNRLSSSLSSISRRRRHLDSKCRPCFSPAPTR